MKHSARAGFTLIELLVVVAILASLIALVGVGVSKIVKSKDNLQFDSAITITRNAITSYQSAYDELPMDGAKTKYSYATNSDPNNLNNVTKQNNPNGAVFLLLTGRTDNGKRDLTQRSFMDHALLKVYVKGQGVMTFQEAIDRKIANKSMWVGFDLVFSRKGDPKNGKKVFAPINISFDTDEGSFTVWKPNLSNYKELIQL